jgi:hypothetical protein
LFERLNPAELKKCLDEWLAAHEQTGREVNIDGKTICGSGTAGGRTSQETVSSIRQAQDKNFPSVSCQRCQAPFGLPDQSGAHPN